MPANILVAGMARYYACKIMVVFKAARNKRHAAQISAGFRMAGRDRDQKNEPGCAPGSWPDTWPDPRA